MHNRQLFSMIDVAELLRVPADKIFYLLQTGQIPEPRLRAGGKRLWTLEEISPISEKLKIQHAFEVAPLKKGGPDA